MQNNLGQLLPPHRWETSACKDIKMYELKLPKDKQTVSIIAYVNTNKKEYAVRLTRELTFQIFDKGKKIFHVQIKRGSYNMETLQRAVNYVFPKMYL